jgi:hypothetical protein
MNNITLKYPKNYLTILNQIFEIENKLKKVQEQNSIQRNIDRLKDFFASEALSDGQGLAYHNPIGENYDETRADCEASISGASHENLEIIEVLKPIIYAQVGNHKMVIQKAIVIVQTKNQKSVTHGKDD